MIFSENDNYRLSEEGKQLALSLLAKHRLWESFLSEMGLPIDHVHQSADEIEHFIDDTLKERLVSQLPDTNEDPHGKRIPVIKPQK